MSKKEIQAMYEDFIENDTEMAAETVRSAYSAIGTALEEYLCAAEEDMFRKAFLYGYAKGTEATEKRMGKTA